MSKTHLLVFSSYIAKLLCVHPKLIYADFLATKEVGKIFNCKRKFSKNSSRVVFFLK